jgi:hypothetical protein
MQIFLSYSSKDRELADQVHLALSAGGHQVFFDRDSLPPGGDYHSRIRNAVAASDLFVFLISRNSVSAGSYALTELKFARDKWAHPKRRVLPVLLEQMDFKQIPSYLTAVTVLEPEGNVSAETLDAVSEMVEMVNDAAMSAQTADKSTSNVTPDTKSAWTHNVTVPVLVAVIGMVGVLGAAAIANWDKLFGGSNGDPEEVDISMPDSTSAGAAFSMLTQIQRGEPATQRIKDYASRISGNDTTVPKLAVDWLPAPPATPHVRMPPVMVLTPTEANDYAEACAAHEDTYQDYPEGIGAVAFDACNWAFYGFTSEQWRAYEYYLRQIANYVEATRDHARVLAAIVASPSAPTTITHTHTSTRCSCVGDSVGGYDAR